MIIISAISTGCACPTGRLDVGRLSCRRALIEFIITAGFKIPPYTGYPSIGRNDDQGLRFDAPPGKTALVMARFRQATTSTEQRQIQSNILLVRENGHVIRNSSDRNATFRIPEQLCRNRSFRYPHLSGHTPGIQSPHRIRSQTHPERHELPGISGCASRRTQGG